MRRVFGILAVSALLLPACAGLASAQSSGAGSRWQTFGDGAWHPHAGNGSQHGLVTSSDQSGSYGGISMVNPPSTLTTDTVLSYDYTSSVTGASGGSPRMVIVFSDGNTAELGPASLTAGTWNTESGNSTDWNLGNTDRGPGGSCGGFGTTTLRDEVSCHAGTTITAIFVVNDSGWLYPSGEAVTLDNIRVNDSVATGPGNSN